jgi:SM-20-related protein
MSEQTYRAVDVDAFERAQPVHEPFDFLYVPHLVRPDALARIRATAEVPPARGSWPLELLDDREGALKALLDELTSDDFARRLGAKLNADIVGKPTMVTIRGRVEAKDGSIHTDSLDKIVTVLVYLNESWAQSGGRLRMLRDKNDIESTLLEVEPVGGNMIAFRRSDNSWHGHYPAEAPRFAFQLNWITNVAARDREMQRHRRSARLKRLVSRLLPRAA